jgi:uncharacterized membrane protein YhaH (DUF805 family)
MSRFLEALRTFAAFSEHSRRREYRYYVLFVVIISVELSMIASLLGTLTTVRRGQIC